MPAFTPVQVSELTAIIGRFHLLFICTNFGPEFLSDEDRQVLVDAGFDPATLPASDKLEEAFRFGMLSAALQQPLVESLSYADFKRFLRNAGGIPLTPVEQHALNLVKHQSYADVKGLGNRVVGAFQQVLIEADAAQRKRYEKEIATQASRAVELRETAGFLASELGHATGDWARDFDRISDYVMHTAFDHGRSLEYERQFGNEAWVYKSVYEGACKHCIRLYLTGGIGSQPRLFKLKDLQANGNNIGRKSADLLAVIGATHPWCRCTLHRADVDHYHYDEKTGGWTLPRSYKNKVDRKSKIEVTVGGKTTVV